jgi:N-acetylmuramoyl-L-alanine amidase
MANVVKLSLGKLACATFVMIGCSDAISACNKSAFKVAIDAGHNLAAPGAISARGKTEFAFNVHLASMIVSRLTANGFPATLLITQGGGGSANLMERAARSNALAPSLFLSIHHDSVQPKYFLQWTFDNRPNHYSDQFKGWSLFVSMKNTKASASLQFARDLGGALLGSGLPYSKHHAEPIKGENKQFLDEWRGVYRYDDLIVLKSSTAPAALLESGIIVNRQEELELESSDRQNAIVSSVTSAVEKFCAER